MQICTREHFASSTGRVVTVNSIELDGVTFLSSHSVRKLCYCCGAELYLGLEVAKLAAKWGYKASCIMCRVRR